MKATDEQIFAWAGRHCIVGTITAQREAFEDAQTILQEPLQHKPITDFDVRGILAAKLTCWHRLSEAESDELVKLFIDHIPDAGKMVTPKIKGWIKKAELDQAKKFGGSINLWLKRHDCDTNVFIEHTPDAGEHKPLITREQHFALREAFAINAADSYFEANPTHDNDVGRMLFERGFARGFDSHERAIEAAHNIKEG